MKGNTMNFKNISLFSLLFAASFVGTSVFGSDEIMSKNDKLTALLNKKEKGWRLVDRKWQKVVAANNMRYELDQLVGTYCIRSAGLNAPDCKKCIDNLDEISNILNHEATELEEELDQLKEEIDEIKMKIMSE